MTRSDYTMADFHAEMRRRGVYDDDHPRRHRKRSAPPPIAEVKALVAAWTPVLAAAPHVPRKKEHGNTIAQVVPCGVHPLHFVKVRASGARSGCPMCEMQIEDVCRSFSPPVHKRSGKAEHAPVIVQDRGVWIRVAGCTCGWRTPPGVTDSDDEYTTHLAITRATEGGLP